jgi:DNA-binding NarL/FixJ family response regulator
VTGPIPPGSDAPAAPTVLLVDDQALVRTGFRMILTGGGLTVVGEASDGNEAVAAVRRLRPRIVLMDIRMPAMDGLEAARRILQDAPDWAPKVIMLTTFDLDRYVYAALAAGASGFLLKDVSPEELIASIRLVSVGDALLAPTITRRLVARFARTSRAQNLHRDLSSLTPRELEILTLLGRGLSNSELAAKLTVGEATVKSHVVHVFAKLGLRDRAQAVVLAYETGLVAPRGGSDQSGGSA